MSLPPHDQGLFISVEGGEGAGKSTFATALRHLIEKRGRSAIQTREPGGTALAEEIRTLLLHPSKEVRIALRAELLLFLAARAEHIEEVILPALTEGKVVICERFHDSTIAYQGFGRHLGAGPVEQLCLLACGDLQPHVTFLLDLDPMRGLQRHLKNRGRELDRLEQEKLSFHQEVRRGYLYLAERYPERITLLNGELPQETLIEMALKRLNYEIHT